MASALIDCPVGLNHKADQIVGPQNIRRIECERCGSFLITRELIDDVRDDINHPLRNSHRARAQVAYHVHQKNRGRQPGELPPLLAGDIVEQIIEADYRPSLQEQTDNLIRLVCERATDFGLSSNVKPTDDAFRIGANGAKTVGFVIDEAIAKKLLVDLVTDQKYPPASPKHRQLLPTFAAWSRYEDLLRLGGFGTRAFLAMPFNRPELDNVWLPKVRQAVKQTGFKLTRVDDEPRPGIIDVRMRQEIKEARFVIVELTHANNGAYWEAGFAEGLGKPVIYSCRAGDEASIHFDTAHLQRIVWCPDTLDRALKQLVAMIRLSVPEAK